MPTNSQRGNERDACERHTVADDDGSIVRHDQQLEISGSQDLRISGFQDLDFRIGFRIWISGISLSRCRGGYSIASATMPLMRAMLSVLIGHVLSVATHSARVMPQPQVQRPAFAARRARRFC